MTASLVNPRDPQRTASLVREASPRRESLAVVPPLRLVPQPEGLLQIHTAPFRGSFAAVFSQALRSAGLGSRVLISQFLKGGVDQGVEGAIRLCGRLEWLRPDTPLCLEVTAPMPVPGPEDDDLPLAAACEAVRRVWRYSCQQMADGCVDLLVLDELGLAVELGYLQAAEVQAALEQRPAHLDVILTGPAMPAALMAMADQVTELRRGC